MKISLNLFASAVLALTSTSAMAEIAKVETIKHDGITYEYTVTEVNGKTILHGRSDSGAPFRLVVTKTLVRGNYDGKFVSFPVPKSAGANAAVIAAR